MDFSLTKEDIFNNAQTALATTRQKRFQNIKFSAELKNGHYILTSEQGKLSLDIIDEIILYIILKFRFCPLWLAKDWYEENSIGTYIGEEKSVNKLKSFIDFGLLYELPSAVATFLMPTNKLASLFNIELGNFINPPYNTLTHTISEEQVMFDFMSGRSDYLKDIPHIPFVSNLGLGKYEKGTVVIPESEYSLRSSFIKKHLPLLNDQEASLTKEVLDGKLITTVDMKELQLVIHKKISKEEFDFKVPDLSILAPRKLNKDGIAMPQSTALEVELTNKGWKSYYRLLDLYWDNLKFGNCIYLTPDKGIKDNLTKAINKLYDDHEKDGIEQTCQFYVVEFEIPYNKQDMIGEY